MGALRSGAAALCLVLVAAAPADPLGDSVTKLVSATQIPGMQVVANAVHPAHAAAAAKPAAGEDSKVTARVKRVWNALLSGTLNRSELSARVNAELTPAVVARSAKQLKALGAPTAWTYTGSTATGTMTSYHYRVEFSTSTPLRVTMSVGAGGKITDFAIDGD